VVIPANGPLSRRCRTAVRRRPLRSADPVDHGRRVVEAIKAEIARPTCPELLGALAQERVRITDSIERLAAARAVLDRLIQAGDQA
jgi:phage terminase small subunit